ncbi:hypothetical protein IAI18_15070 [Acetobacteraceae bacterium H6797]|nr:hypothetical protein [Acetobacteraceae bacterium H6797]
MPLPSNLPPAFHRYQEIGGVLDFELVEPASGDIDSILAGFRAMLPDQPFDADLLRSLGARPIEEARFLGDWYDPQSRRLIERGDFTTSHGHHLHDPPRVVLETQSIANAVLNVPQPGTGGQFAYAFSQPPYPLVARWGEVQSLFDAIRGFILPPGVPAEILDWYSPRLPEVSPAFQEGMEWWGVYLFSIHLPSMRRLTLILGNATD